MIFHHIQRSIVPNQIPKLYLDGLEIERVDNHKLLGIIFDRHLTWNDHLWYITDRINSICGVLYSLKNFVPS